MKVFSAKKLVEMGINADLPINLLVDTMLEDDGKEVTPYNEEAYINSRLQLVHRDLVVDKDKWEPFDMEGH